MPSRLLVPSHASSGRNRNVVQRLKTILHGRKPTAPDTHRDGIGSENTYYKEETHGRSFAAEIVVPTIQNNESTRVAPIDALPVEILGEIFFLVTFSDVAPLYSPCIEPSSKAGPLVLCRICSYWRQIAIGTPLLWASIYIQNKPSPFLIKLWIERSQDLPFSFFWNFEKRIDAVYRSYDYNDAVLPLLVAEMPRWRRMSFMEMDKNMVQKLLQLSLSPALALEDVLVSHRVCSSELHAPIFDMLPTCALTRFAWRTDNLPIPPTHELWSQLTHIQIGTKIGIDEAKIILEQSPNVIEVFFGYIMEKQVAQGDQRTLLPNLISLRVGVAGVDTTVLFDHFTCPRLQALVFNTMGERENSLSRLTNFLERSSCPTDKLGIVNHYLSEQELLLLLSVPAFHLIQNVVIVPGKMADDECKRVTSFLRTLKPETYFLEAVNNPTLKDLRKQLGWSPRRAKCIQTGIKQFI